MSKSKGKVCAAEGVEHPGARFSARSPNRLFGRRSIWKSTQERRRELPAIATRCGSAGDPADFDASKMGSDARAVEPRSDALAVAPPTSRVWRSVQRLEFHPCAAAATFCSEELGGLLDIPRIVVHPRGRAAEA